jgi:hypothetical protein
MCTNVHIPRARVKNKNDETSGASVHEVMITSASRYKQKRDEALPLAVRPIAAHHLR